MKFTSETTVESQAGFDFFVVEFGCNFHSFHLRPWKVRGLRTRSRTSPMAASMQDS
jgi:hypothetical protein